MCIVIATSSFSYARNSELYLLTEECPQSINAYVEKNISKFLSSKYNEGEISLEDITVGEAFVIEKENITDVDVYYFPVFQKNELKYTFRVYEAEGSIIGILSSYLVKEIQTIVGGTTINNPARLFMSNGNIVAVIDDEIIAISKDPLGRKVSKKILNDNMYKSSKELHIVKIDGKAKIEYTMERKLLSTISSSGS